MDFIVGFSARDAPHCGELLSKFVTHASTREQNEKVMNRVPGGHVPLSLVTAFHGADWVYAMTGIVLMNRVNDQISICEFRMEMGSYPWGLPVPQCGMGCGTYGISVTQGEGGVSFQCVCGAEAEQNGKPGDVQEVDLKTCPGTYMRPFPWSGNLTWRKGPLEVAERRWTASL